MGRVIRSTRVVLPDGTVGPAGVEVRDGRIAAVVPGRPRADVDLGDLVLMPGLVDTHVHVNEPGRTEWEGFATATRAALAGGVTTIVDMPLNSLPPTVTAAALAEKRAAATGQCHVDVGFWGGAVPGNAGELAALHAAGVFGFKAFLADSGVPEFPPVTPLELRQAMAAVDALFLVHAEDPAGLLDARPSRVYADFERSRPGAAERAAVAAALDAAEATGSRVHVLHVSDADAAAEVAAGRARGVRVTAETCPHYLTLDAALVPDGATEFKCCPPIRGAANRDRLWAALAEGALDIVVSDHSPSTPALKRPDTGDFAAAWGGIASLQLGLPLVWTAAAARGHDIADVVRWMATGPADLVGLRHKGRIAVGADADLVAFDPEATSTVAPDGLHHRHPVTPYAGQRLTGVVRRVWLGGVKVTPGDPPRGKLLSRSADLLGAAS
ncbi:allantoinase AllB [Asanoa sp. WMMD1127]|uniref:allantoinase AllB n=1 Tax=Asanoa sp. WMMD1127 TaxID=3016107 RepID=UPI002415ECB5|nr:allantoinase AllB [Asanoa sp. WMMD1127]MDG4824286.1 allantoinase AllB [Asanoa sp. WMMD1127]